MTLSFEISDFLKSKIIKLNKDPVLKKVIYKKINEIINSDEFTILHYKFLRHDKLNRQRVHILKSFVLIFVYLKKENHIIFLDFDHHDNIYKKI
jgi:mRNA-degrading endonuclease RelE of RelBE toxin-antitoxin system